MLAFKWVLMMLKASGVANVRNTTTQTITLECSGTTVNDFQLKVDSAAAGGTFRSALSGSACAPVLLVFGDGVFRTGNASAAAIRFQSRTESLP
mgnify:CR=1 FL=1